MFALRTRYDWRCWNWAFWKNTFKGCLDLYLHDCIHARDNHWWANTTSYLRSLFNNSHSRTCLTSKFWAWGYCTQCTNDKSVNIQVYRTQNCILVKWGSFIQNTNTHNKNTFWFLSAWSVKLKCFFSTASDVLEVEIFW